MVWKMSRPKRSSSGNTSWESGNEWSVNLWNISIRIYIGSVYVFMRQYMWNVCKAGSSHRRCSVKKVFLKSLQNWQENTCVKVSLLKKVQVLSCEFRKVSKNIFFKERLQTVASESHGANLLIETLLIEYQYLFKRYWRSSFVKLFTVCFRNQNERNKILT